MRDFIYSTRIFLALVILLNLTACGTSDGGSGSSNEETKAKEAEPTLQSIALESKDQLPKCGKENDTQLSYIIDLDQFFVCDSGDWAEIEIRDEQSKVATVEEDDSYHTWTDPFTGLKWVLAGTGDYQSFSYSAVQTCATSGFRMPTKAEGIAARAHGIRSVAEELGHLEDFWVESDTSGGALPWRIYTSGSQQVVATTTNSIFCIKI